MTSFHSTPSNPVQPLSNPFNPILKQEALSTVHSRTSERGEFFSGVNHIDIRYVDERKTIHIKCDSGVATILVGKMIKNRSPETKAITAIRYELRGSSFESHIYIVDSMENKNIIKNIGWLQLVNKGKLSNAEFFRALFKLFQRKECVDFLLDFWRGKSVILCCLVCIV